MKIFPGEIKPVMLGHPAQEVAYQKASEGFEVAKVAGAMAAEASIFWRFGGGLGAKQHRHVTRQATYSYGHGYELFTDDFYRD